MHFIIDQGNSFTKIGLFNESELIEVWRISDSEIHSFLRKKIVAFEVSDIFASSVRDASSSIINTFESPISIQSFDPSSPIPIGINYATPHTLGLDRIANASAAYFLGYSDALIVDCGSCITYTLLLQNQLEGGAIAPGMRMRFKAMHHFTGKLPFLEESPKELPLYGKSTHDSMLVGGIRGLSREIEGMIGEYCSEIPELFVILTGGDAKYLGSHIKSAIFANENLTLVGLNQIYLYQKA